MAEVELLNMRGWNEETGIVSMAFDRWKLTDAEIRAFCRLTIDVVHAEYAKRWEELGQEPSDPDGPDMETIFHERIHGLWPHDFEWMLLAAVWKDAVTAFEVYLEQGAQEVLKRNGLKVAMKGDGRGPSWSELASFYRAALQVHIDTPSVRDIRDLRHILTHNRGEWRSDQQRKRFDEGIDGCFPTYRVELTRGKVEAACDCLAMLIRTVDPHVWTYSWGGKRLLEADELQ